MYVFVSSVEVSLLGRAEAVISGSVHRSVAGTLSGSLVPCASPVMCPDLYIFHHGSVSDEADGGTDAEACVQWLSDNWALKVML